MKLKLTETPRTFVVKGHEIRDFGKIHLADGEMVSFVTDSGKECDFAAKDWGFYLGPSVNSRLKKEGFKVALVANEQGQLYVLAADREKLDAFHRYLSDGQQVRILCWLDEWLPSTFRPV